jgi:hypothetical protein
VANDKDKVEPKPEFRWTSAHNRVSIWGRVIDAVTQKPIAGADVMLTRVPATFAKTLEHLAKYAGYEWTIRTQRPDRTRSRADGLFYFLALPDGDYEIRALLPNCGRRYGEVTQKIKVSGGDENRSGQDVLKGMWVGLALQPTVIRGRIYDAAKKAGVVMAEVRLKGSGERTFSGPRGDFTLGPVEASKSKRTLECFAQGYLRKEQEDIVVAKPGLLDLGDIHLESARRG